MKFEKRKTKNNLRNFSKILLPIGNFIFFAAIFAFLQFSAAEPFSRKVSAEDLSAEIENAVYVRQEFFGAAARVVLPTKEKRENLLKLAEKYPDNQIVLEKLADANEKLLRFDEAEANLIHLTEIDFSANEKLAAFYERRGFFEKQTAVLEKILFSTAPEKRAAAFEILIYTARSHDLKKYLSNEFYTRVVAENPNLYPLFVSLIENSVSTEDYAAALDFTRQARRQFPAEKDFLLDKEIEILLALKRSNEAETVYRAAFDPFWSDEEAQNFYDFLSNQNHLRVYGAEMKNRFKKNPADFDAAVRLVDYQNHDYEYDNDDLAPIIAKLEAAKKSWTIDELLIATRMLLRRGDGETASRFLYTLYLREDFQKNFALRARALYQIFEMFADAEKSRLPLTRGDLHFYEDIARADTNPGIATGILSLILSDTNPREKLAAQEKIAVEKFNRAAAYRTFLAYKKEFPTSNELAQMYLDIIGFYAATEETEIAEQTLNEFVERHEEAEDFPVIALKLADAFNALDQKEKARETYQKILDYIGGRTKSIAPQRAENYAAFLQFTNPQPPTISSEKTFERNEGINIPKPAATPRNDYYYDVPANQFHDYLGQKDAEITYAEILDRYVAALAAENKTAEILALYSKEIEKYPNEEWLYEKRLAWLENTNLTEEQLNFYRVALARFQTNDWRDKLARFFLRRDQTTDFKNFSEDVIGNLNEAEIAEFVAQTVEPNLANSSRDFDKRVRLALLDAAHKRFPQNLQFVKSLLNFYSANNYIENWRALAAEYYFESKEIREEFLNDLAAKNDLRNFLEKSKDKTDLIYELFRADASARLSDFENALPAYRKLNELYPNTPEFSARLVNFTRSFGQKNAESLREAATVAKTQADFLEQRTDLRTKSGEIFAELGDFEKARAEWKKLNDSARGEQNNYLATATVFWDYFQYDDALQTIREAREKFDDDALYAFESGVIFEARHKQNEALREYVKALGTGEDDTQKEKASGRIAALFKRAANKTNGAENSFLKTLDAAFAVESRNEKDASNLALGYAETLFKINEKTWAEKTLNSIVSQSRDADFLNAARDFYAREEATDGERFVLKRMIAAAENPRSKIMFELQLAENFETAQQPDNAKITLANLVKIFPTNYGVLTEAANFYARLGDENAAANVLQNALPKSRGTYRKNLAQKLAARLVRLDRLDSAEKILLALHEENRADAQIFKTLAAIYVRKNEPEKIRKIFNETVAALKASDADRRELDREIGDLRASMIDAFTKLKDYKSAIEQHIEIINREPDDEALIENAIQYVKRYGGAETLLNYYQKTAAEAFKNYRWNVVLAKIYEANGDADNAVKNYEAAIGNQPEMFELYDAIADIKLKRNDFDAALKNLDKVLQLTNDAPEFVRKKIEALKKAGRLAEIEAEQAKLPAETKTDLKIDRFVEAGNLAAGEREKARELYKQAFAALLENPLQTDLKAADLDGYARIVRDEKSLAEINRSFWTLREKLSAIATETNSTNAGEARKRLSVLDGAMIESIGNLAKTVATDDELANLHEDLRRRIEDDSPDSESRGKIASLTQDLSRRAGFGDLEELILLQRLKAANTPDDRNFRLQNLLDFYRERGAYRKIFDALEQFGGDCAQKAEAARLVGNREKELEALRAIYRKLFDAPQKNDENVARYLEILRAEHSDELNSLTEKSSAYQLQLINFLVGAGEAKLAHRAIENSRFSAAWKKSRGAEISLALREFDETAECFFCDALQFDSIGNLIAQTPDKTSFLVNDDWFRLTREYGEWLFEKQKIAPENAAPAPDKFLTAMTENLPNNADEQFKLGEFYLADNQTEKANEHLRLAIEIENAESVDALKSATLLAAYLKNNQPAEAEQLQTEILAEENIKSATIYFNAMRKYGFADKARIVLPKIIVKFLTGNNTENSPEFQNLIRAVAKSFADENEKSKYFSNILQMRPTDESLAKMLVEENLIAREKQTDFYQSIIERAGKSSDSDYRYAEIFQRVWRDTADAESIYDQENDYKIEELGGERFEYQKKYLELLIELRENEKAEILTTEIEKEFAARYARPEWLRLAKIRLQIRRGRFDLNEAERFAGITTSDAAIEINLPSVERLNAILDVFRTENAEAGSLRINKDFYARMLAFGQFDAANFVNLARAFFQNNETANARRVLQLLADAGDDAKRETILAEIAAFDVIKANSADAVKIKPTETNDLWNGAKNLTLAAETALEFKQIDAAIEFRRRLFATTPEDAPNRVKFAELLLKTDARDDAVNLLNGVINDRNALRETRWQARLLLIEAGAATTLPNVKFDALSQVYIGDFAAQNNQTKEATDFFINSLIADRDAAINARQKLAKTYFDGGNYFAAIEIAATDKTAKSDDLLDALVEAAMKIGDFTRAIEFERAKSDGGTAEKIQLLQNALDEKAKRATDLRIDAENTRKL